MNTDVIWSLSMEQKNTQRQPAQKEQMQDASVGNMPMNGLMKRSDKRSPPVMRCRLFKPLAATDCIGLDARAVMLPKLPYH
jgi:hypothetical protein